MIFLNYLAIASFSGATSAQDPLVSTKKAPALAWSAILDHNESWTVFRTFIA